MNQNGTFSAISFVLTVCLITLVTGCASKSTLNTTSGRPEIKIESLHIKPSDISGLLANYYVNQGYSIVRQSNQTLVLRSPILKGTFSRYHNQLTFNLIDSRNNVRVIAQMERLFLPLTGGSRVSSVTTLPPGGSFAQEVQNVLSGIQDSLVNEEQFRGIKTGSKSPQEDSEENEGNQE